MLGTSGAFVIAQKSEIWEMNQNIVVIAPSSAPELWLMPGSGNQQELLHTSGQGLHYCFSLVILVWQLFNTALRFCKLLYHMNMAPRTIGVEVAEAFGRALSQWTMVCFVNGQHEIHPGLCC